MNAKNLLRQVISKNQEISVPQYLEVLRDYILYYDEQYEQADQALRGISLMSADGRRKRIKPESERDIAMSKRDAYQTALQLFEKFVVIES